MGEIPGPVNESCGAFDVGAIFSADPFFISCGLSLLAEGTASGRRKRVWPDGIKMPCGETFLQEPRLIYQKRNAD